MSFPHTETWQAATVSFNTRINTKKSLGFDPAWF